MAKFYKIYLPFLILSLILFPILFSIHASDEGEFISASKILLCKNDPNFRDIYEQGAIISKIFHELNILIEKIDIKRIEGYNKFPLVAPFEEEFLSQNSYFCRENITFDNILFDRLKVDKSFSSEYLNIVLVPYYILLDDYPSDLYYGTARYGSVYAQASEPLPNNLKRNIIFISTLPFAISGYEEFFWVVKHEFGHGYGATHYPDSGEPLSNRSGAPIMRSRYPHPHRSRDDYYSTYSINSFIHKLIDVSKQYSLNFFGRRSCGNGIWEPRFKEQCEPHSDDIFNLCDPLTCKLNKNAQCTPFYHLCCTLDGKIAPNSQVCSKAQKSECLEESHCDQISYECPAPKFAQTGTSCGKGKSCSDDGRCLPEACMDGEELCNFEPCVIGCKPINNGTCYAHLKKLDGTKCSTETILFGQCISGQCIAYIFNTKFPTSETQPTSELYTYILIIVYIIFFINTTLICIFYSKNKRTKRNLPQVQLHLDPRQEAHSLIDIRS